MQKSKINYKNIDKNLSETIRMFQKRFNNYSLYENIEELNFDENIIINAINLFIVCENNNEDISKSIIFPTLSKLTYSFLKLKVYNKQNIDNLLNLVKSSKYFSKEINGLIINDVNSIENSEFSLDLNVSKLINEVLLESNKNNLNIISKNVIYLIVNVLSNPDRNNQIINRISNRHKLLESKQKSLEHFESDEKEYKDLSDKYKKVLVEKSKKLKIKIISLILSVVLSFSIGVCTTSIVDGYTRTHEENSDINSLDTLLGALVSFLSLFISKVGVIDILKEIKKLRTQIKNSNLELQEIEIKLLEIKEKIKNTLEKENVYIEDIEFLINEILLMAGFSFLNENEKDFIENEKQYIESIMKYKRR